MKRFLLAGIMILLWATLIAGDEDVKTVLFPDNHLCLEATGRMVVKADKATISFAVVGYGSSLRGAVDQARTRTANIATALGRLGVTPDNIATGSFYSGKNRESLLLSDKKDFSATLRTTVTVRKLDTLDEIVLTLADQKLEDLSPVSFSLDDQSSARQQARELAFNRICEQRDAICRILGVKVTDVQLIDEAPFTKLPWETQNNYVDGYSEGKYSGAFNSVTRSEALAERDDTVTGKGLYSPEVTVETTVRVLYRISLKP
jgi:uncharacterized protein YggE